MMYYKPTPLFSSQFLRRLYMVYSCISSVYMYYKPTPVQS